jgi:excisionase family DNA binding protein
MPGDLLTSTEAAKLLGVDRSTVARYVRQGRLPAIKLPSGHTRIRRKDVDRLIRGEQPGRAQPKD